MTPAINKAPLGIINAKLPNTRMTNIIMMRLTTMAIIAISTMTTAPYRSTYVGSVLRTVAIVSAISYLLSYPHAQHARLIINCSARHCGQTAKRGSSASIIGTSSGSGIAPIGSRGSAPLHSHPTQ